MLEAVLALAAQAGNTVVAAATTDVWETSKGKLARLLGRGDPKQERTAEGQLEKTRKVLTVSKGLGLEQARTAEANRWKERFAGLLEEDSGVEGDLRAVVEDIQAELRGLGRRATVRRYAGAVVLFPLALAAAAAGYALMPAGPPSSNLPLVGVQVEPARPIPGLKVRADTEFSDTGAVSLRLYLAASEPRVNAAWKFVVISHTQAPAVTHFAGTQVSNQGPIAGPGSANMTIVTGHGHIPGQLPASSPCDYSFSSPRPEAIFSWQPQSGIVRVSGEYLNAMIPGIQATNFASKSTIERSLCPAGDRVVDSGPQPSRAPGNNSWTWVDIAPGVLSGSAPGPGFQPIFLMTHSISGAELDRRHEFYSGILLGVAAAAIIAGLQTAVDRWSGASRRNRPSQPASSIR